MNECRDFLHRRHASFSTHLSFMELSGMLGDLGTLIPLTLLMSRAGSIRPGAALLWTGVFNTVSAYQWDMPMPVQPMKTIAAVAITEELSRGATSAAGIFTGGCVAIFGATGFINSLDKIVPRCVVSGLQLGLGLRMALQGMQIIMNSSPVLGAFSCLVSVAFENKPTALLLVILGFSIALFQFFLLLPTVQYKAYTLGVSPRTPSKNEWITGILLAGLPQLPLTCLNSVIAVVAVAQELFPNQSTPSRRSVAFSVGLMNLCGCFFGGMPSCHGCGGLVGQYKFGARSGASILILGLIKFTLVLIFGDKNIEAAIASFPSAILGALLAIVGLELARTGARPHGNSIPALATAAATISQGTGIGAAIGLVFAYTERAAVHINRADSPLLSSLFCRHDHSSHRLSNDDALSNNADDEETKQ
mmetsp:Transcript_14651/g.17774  ORF Transcript_14651/g.17774 Transcript_14651/m.17774 type:complete len:419 (+) Transcript_14651:3-1259(+)